MIVSKALLNFIEYSKYNRFKIEHKLIRNLRFSIYIFKNKNLLHPSMLMFPLQFYTKIKIDSNFSIFY